MEKILKEILGKLNNLEQGQRDLQQSQRTLQEGQQSLESQVREISQSQARMENDLGEKISALFDAREIQTDVNERICDSLNRIEGKLDRLTLKVASHDAALKRVK